MANFDLPRRGSYAAKALAALQSVGGTASIHSVIRICSWKGGRSAFQMNVVERLHVTGMATACGDEMRISHAGQKYLGLAPREAATQGEPAGPRYVPPFRPRVQRATGPLVIREGALDFRTYPSLLGGQSIPYRSAERD